MFSGDQLKRAASLTEEDFVQLGKCRRPHNRPGFARRIRRGLLKVEQLHPLARDVFYGRRGRINARELWEQMNTCSCLKLDPGVHRLLAGVRNLPVPERVRPDRQWNRSLPAGTRQPHRVG
jgi:hypothetical protein